MSASQEDLSQFLDELGGRRRRLLALVGSDAGSRDAVIDELNDLGEQLIVADEELRVQQEALEDARRQVEVLHAERAQLFGAATEAWVLTDDNGLVRRTTRAADRLTMLPPARVTPRPIATWFAVPDRPLVRRMIGRREETEAQVLERAELRRPDGSTVVVRVALTRTVGGVGDRTMLRWELTPVDRQPPTLRVVETEPALGAEQAVRPAGPASSVALELALAELANRLARRQASAQAWALLLADAHSLVPATDHVGLVRYTRRGPGEALAASDAVSGAADLAQLEVESPLRVTLAQNRVMRLPDTTAPNTWPAFAARATELGIRGVLTVPLTLTGHPGGVEAGLSLTAMPDQRIGALTFYTQQPGGFDPGSERIATLVAGHAAAALALLGRQASLEDAMVTRQMIGEAVGVLVERHRLTSAAAFDLLVRRSQNANLKLRDLARVVVETGQNPAEVSEPREHREHREPREPGRPAP